VGTSVLLPGTASGKPRHESSLLRSAYPINACHQKLSTFNEGLKRTFLCLAKGPNSVTTYSPKHLSQFTYLHTNYKKCLHIKTVLHRAYMPCMLWLGLRTLYMAVLLSFPIFRLPSSHPSSLLSSPISLRPPSHLVKRCFLLEIFIFAYIKLHTL